jgi:hypothetical protein
VLSDGYREKKAGKRRIGTLRQQQTGDIIAKPRHDSGTILQTTASSDHQVPNFLAHWQFLGE